MWLVFRDEGTSLHALLYAQEGGVVQQGLIWRRLVSLPRPQAQRLTAALLVQVLTPVVALGHIGVQHRDIKPGNIFLSPSQRPSHSLQTLGSAQRITGASVRLGDFGSALNASQTHQTLFGAHGPSELDLTAPYAAPEVLAATHHLAIAECVTEAPAEWQECLTHTWPIGQMWPVEAYDAWSVGVTVLEVVLGASPHSSSLAPPPAAMALAETAMQQAWDASMQRLAGTGWATQHVAPEGDWRRAHMHLLHTWLASCFLPPGWLRDTLRRHCSPLRGRPPSWAVHRPVQETLVRAEGVCSMLAALNATRTSEAFVAVAPSSCHPTGPLWPAARARLRKAAWRARCQAGVTVRQGHKHPTPDTGQEGGWWGGLLNPGRNDTGESAGGL